MIIQGFGPVRPWKRKGSGVMHTELGAVVRGKQTPEVVNSADVDIHHRVS